ncbi:MAG: NUDIX hydrolase [Pseudomonadota bacterium]
MACMMRECFEETSLKIGARDWLPIATINETTDKDDVLSQVEIYAARYNGITTDAIQSDHERIEWFPYSAVPDNAISNLQFLIPMAREHLKGHGSKHIVITY